MIGVIGEPEPERRLVRSFLAALFECLLEAVELIPLVCAVLACAAALCIIGDMVYQLMFDPNAVNVASRLDLLSIDPNKWIPGS